jgi:Domain of unknown function (DUF4129)
MLLQPAGASHFLTRALCLALAFCCLWLAHQAAAETERTYSLPEYVRALDRLAALARRTPVNPSSIGKAIFDLRGGIKVQGEGQTFQVNTESLTDGFEKVRSGGDARDLLVRIQALKDDAQLFQQPPSDVSAPRATLNQIVARPEFNQVRGPSWLDRLKYRIQLWIYRLLLHFFNSSSAPIVGRVFVWGLVALAVVVLAIVIYRNMKQNARMETINTGPLPVSAKQWRVWMDEAQAAAAKGLWRDAVHLAYWAGIAFLEESGMWRPDRARTPREYLRLLPESSGHRSTLSRLTRQFEITWYANQQAGPETFNEALGYLENLGCRRV